MFFDINSIGSNVSSSSPFPIWRLRVARSTEVRVLTPDSASLEGISSSKCYDLKIIMKLIYLLSENSLYRSRRAYRRP